MTPIELVVGRNVRALREAADLSQSDVAAGAGLSRSSVANLEAGRQNITIGTLQILAQVLHTDAADLLRGEGEERSLLARLRGAEHHARRCDLRVAEAEEAAARAEARMHTERAARWRAEAAVFRAELGEVEG